MPLTVSEPHSQPDTFCLPPCIWLQAVLRHQPPSPSPCLFPVLQGLPRYHPLQRSCHYALKMFLVSKLESPVPRSSSQWTFTFFLISLWDWTTHLHHLIMDMCMSVCICMCVHQQQSDFYWALIYAQVLENMTGIRHNEVPGILER